MDLIRTLLNATGLKPVATAADMPVTPAVPPGQRVSVPLPGVQLPPHFPPTQAATIQSVNTPAQQITVSTPQGPVTLPLPPGFPATAGQVVQLAVNVQAQTITMTLQGIPGKNTPQTKNANAPDKLWTFAPGAAKGGAALFRPYDKPDAAVSKAAPLPAAPATMLNGETAPGLVMKLMPLPLPALARLVLTAPATAAPQPSTMATAGPWPQTSAVQTAIITPQQSATLLAAPASVLKNPSAAAPAPVPDASITAAKLTAPAHLSLPAAAGKSDASAPSVMVTPVPASPLPAAAPHGMLVTITALHMPPPILAGSDGTAPLALPPAQGDVQAGSARAIVIAHDTSGRPVLQVIPPPTGAGTGVNVHAMAGAPVLIGSPLASPLPEGSVVTYVPVQNTAAASPAPGTAPAPGAWDDMTRLLQSIPVSAVGTAPESTAITAQTQPPLTAALPTLMLPGIHPDARLMAPLAALVLGALRDREPLSIIRPQTLDAVKRARLDDALETILNDPAVKMRLSQDTAQTEWKTHTVPYVHDGQVHRMMLHVRDDAHAPHTAEGGDRPVRFVFDLSLDRMGDVQLEGLYRKTKKTSSLDLTLRTELALSPAMKAQIGTVYRTILEGAGMTGDVIFQGTRDHFLFIKPHDTPAAAGWVA